MATNYLIGKDCFVGFSYRYVPSFRMAGSGSRRVKSALFGICRHIIFKTGPDAAGSGAVKVDIDDFAAFTMMLEGGIPAVCQRSRNAYGCGNQLELSIFGDLGSLHIGYEYSDQMIWVHPHEETGSKTREEVHVPDSYKLLQMQDFADFALQKQNELTPTLEDGYRNKRALEAVMQSAQTGRTIRLAAIGTMQPEKEA